MDNNQGYKNRALKDLEGNWGKSAIASLIVFIIAGGISTAVTAPMGNNLSLSYSTQGIWTLLCLPLEWGLTVFFLNLIRHEDIRYERLFDGYKDFVRVFLASFLCQLAVTIGCILLIVPGIILGLMFSQYAYILKDDPQISALDALMKSMKMMDGHKMELFWLYLSFIGWAILALFTFGFGLLLLVPYVETTLAHFYEDLKAEQAFA